MTDSDSKGAGANDAQLISIVTPAFNEGLNVELMYREICDALAGHRWEWLIVDDHSTDETFDIARRLSDGDSKVKCIRLSRNFGAHAAAMCGLQHAGGACAVLLAADLQDPPAVIPALLEEWRGGADVVWAVRRAREGESLMQRSASRLYHSWMGRLPGLERLPAQGSDFLLADRKVLKALRNVSERNASVLALIAWLGFRHAYVPYTKRPRLRGRSGWTFGRRIKLAVDSMILFSYLPIRLIMWFGFIIAGVGLVYAVAVVITGLRGSPVAGWSSTMVAVLVLGGTQMIMVGVIGQYLWRALDEVRRRPLYVIEQSIHADGP